ncbi:HD domain-containing protein [Paenibacillus gansuensis]|uniref:HD domain-containing protein n=1 Tax=Paenibacillus gansuensis TaxID=306542 RepID=A0ABW5PFG7_9BACL
MDQQHILEQARLAVQKKMGDDSSGHDWWHTYRVAETAKTIAAEEHADVFLCELTALLHDMADEKLNDDPEQASRDLYAWMLNTGVELTAVDHVMDIISTMSFKGGNRPPVRTLEGKIVQDADRLDAIGAMGIARVFAYSGWKGRPIHDPRMSPREQLTPEQYRNGNDTAINHFYEKLLKLKDLMNTTTGRNMAAERHKFMELYLDQFYAEWEGQR